MKLFNILVCTLALANSAMAWAGEDICEPVYGKHKLFHHIKNWVGPEKFSDPMLVEIEIRRDGTLVSRHHFDENYFETAVFSQSFPQLAYSHRSGGWEHGCKSREPECETLREEVKSYTLNSLDYLDIESEKGSTPRPQVALQRKKVLACATSLRRQIINSTLD